MHEYLKTCQHSILLTLNHFDIIKINTKKNYEMMSNLKFLHNLQIHLAYRYKAKIIDSEG